MAYTALVGIVTHYGLDDPGIASQWDRHFLSRTDMGPTMPPAQWVPGLFPGSKEAGAWRGVDQSPSSSDKVKERGKL